VPSREFLYEPLAFAALLLIAALWVRQRTQAL
jgi:hypothetical protein